MKRSFCKAVSLLATLAMVLALFSFAPVRANADGAPITLTILQTSDLHGNIYPVDYYTDKAANVGLAAVATVVNAVRAENPNTLLVDTGDVIQGTPLVSFYNKKLDVKNPMADVMNYMKYDAATLGNHEFNFGLDVLKNYTSTAAYPIVVANALKADGTPYFTPYVVKTIAGVKVGILGLTNQAIPNWENPENYAGIHFQSAVEAAKKWVPVLRDTEKVDVVIVLAHTGPEKDLGDPTKSIAESTKGESELYALTQVPGVDAIFSGHAHLSLSYDNVNGVAVVQPDRWGSKVGRVDLTLEATGDAAHPWKVTTKKASLIATDGAKADEGVKNYAKAYHDATVAYINTVIGKSSGAFDGALSQQQDTAIMDLVNKIQLETGKADLSIAASLSNKGYIPAGDVRVKDVASVYIYENYLYVIEVTGQQIKDALEHSAKYFNQYDFGATPNWTLINPNIRGYNFDMLYGPGVTYKIDITKPVGQRIVGLTYKGKPMSMTQKFKLAVNNYRYNGGGGYTMLSGAPILYKSSIEIREQIIDYFKSHPNVSPVCDNHFTVVGPDYYNSKHWAEDSINLLIRNSIAALDTSGNFNPDKKITRDEFNSMLIKAFGAAPTSAGAGNVKRQDAIAEVLYACGAPTATPPADAFKNYSDADKISPWLARAVWGAIQAGIVKGDGGALRPQDYLTRAEAATLIANARFRPITILSTNDVHGSLSNDGSYIGSAVISAYINQNRAKNPNGTLLLDAGDSMQGTMTSNLFYGKAMIEVMNAMKYDAAGIGNHEFDWTAAKLAERVKEANYPFLSANIFEKATGNRPEWAKPYALFNKNGLKIGVIGFTSTETPSIVLADNIKDYNIVDPVPYINEYAEELRAQGADLIVVLAHEGGSSISSGAVAGPIADLAKQFVGVDAIVGGHRHNNFAGTAAGIPFVSNKDKGRGIGDIELRYDVVTGKVVSAKETTIVPVATFAPDATVKAIVDRYETEVAPMKNEVVAKTDIDITTDYNAESLMGNLVADIMLKATPGADFAFTNAGGLRSSIKAGDITVGSVYAVMPFDNTLFTMKLTGAQIKEILEQGAKLEKGMIQVSGLKFEYDSTLPAGSRVTKMTKLDGTPIALDQTYTIVTNDFLAGGQDGFTTFAKGSDRVNTFRLIRDEMINWFKAETAAGRVIHPVIDGRVTKIK